MEPTRTLPRLALITAARNEEALLSATIESVVAQTVRPVRWVIVSDGSTDRTDEIVRSHAQQNPWIELLRMPDQRDRSFAAKATCFNAGFARLRPDEYDVIGNLDADITFGPDYYEYLLGQFAADPRLGVAGTPYVEDFSRPDQHTYAHRFADLNHVSGACQTFRKECFAQVGGYVPIKGGGIDWVAVTTARMNGWNTRTFTGRICFHHRKMGTADRSPLKARLRHGREDYLLGGHPAWQVLRSFFQMRNRPYVLGGAALLLGYLQAMFSGRPRPIPDTLVRFHRAEQSARMRAMLRGGLGAGRGGAGAGTEIEPRVRP
jgi:glycosyltransferase involved in cell wall biosynthesis